MLYLSLEKINFVMYAQSYPQARARFGRSKKVKYWRGFSSLLTPKVARIIQREIRKNLVHQCE